MPTYGAASTTPQAEPCGIAAHKGQEKPAAGSETNVIDHVRHGRETDGYGGRYGPACSGTSRQMIPTALPARSKRSRMSATCSLLCSAHKEQRSKVIPAGVAGGRAKFT